MKKSTKKLIGKVIKYTALAICVAFVLYCGTQIIIQEINLYYSK